MAKKEKKKAQRFRAGIRLNILLWFSFSLFAVIFVVIFMAVQGLLVGNRYREQTVEIIRTAAEEMLEQLEDAEDTTSLSVWQQKQRLEAQYDVTIRVLYSDGYSVFSEGSEDVSYPEIAEALKRRLSTGGDHIVIGVESTLAYATAFTRGRQTFFVYVSSSIARLNTLEWSLRWMSLGAALFSVVLAFIASGFMAMLITKPVTEVTEQAKELARGRYDLNIKRDYFSKEIAELSDALDYARREISRADTMQKELIANVSHDFKTPLTMIKAYASMIREISGDNKQKRDAHAQIIIDEADRLATLVDDVLDLSKLHAGVEEEQDDTFNLSETVYLIAERFNYLKETQGYHFLLNVEDDCYVFADKERIEQVVYNLIGNAVNYTGEDKTVRIRLYAKEQSIRFEVEDTGKGIPEEEQATIWDRYYRSQETHKRPVRGTGLGLSIVKGILLAQNCPFGVQSELGKGSTFWVELPAPPDDYFEDDTYERLIWR